MDTVAVDTVVVAMPALEVAAGSHLVPVEVVHNIVVEVVGLHTEAVDNLYNMPVVVVLAAVVVEVQEQELADFGNHKIVRACQLVDVCDHFRISFQSPFRCIFYPRFSGC